MGSGPSLVGDEKLAQCTNKTRCSASGPSLVGDEKLAQCTNKNKVFRSGLLPLEEKWSRICAGKGMCFTQDECVMRDPCLLLFGRVCLLWLLGCCGNSTVNELREASSCSSSSLVLSSFSSRRVQLLPCCFFLGPSSMHVQKPRARIHGSSRQARVASAPCG